MKLHRETVGHGLSIEEKFGYAGALRIGDTVHVAGQLARDVDGNQVPGPLATKLTVAYGNIASLLAKMDVAMDRVVQAQIHVDVPLPESLADIRAVSRQHLRLADVALTVVQVTGLNDADGMVEISAVAGLEQKKKEGEMAANPQAQSYSTNHSFAGRLGAADVVVHGDILYVSGQLPLDANGELLFPGDIAGQFGAALDSVDRALRSVGSSISRVLALDIFTSQALTAESFDAFCSAHRERMSEYRPTGTMVRVAQLPLEGALVYISAIAAR
jgi:enamine deaminase RidA (YjgF/YER057c/UK114 family)